MEPTIVYDVLNENYNTIPAVLSFQLSLISETHCGSLPLGGSAHDHDPR